MHAMPFNDDELSKSTRLSAKETMSATFGEATRQMGN